MDTTAPVPSPLTPLGALEEEEEGMKNELRRRGKKKKKRKGIFADRWVLASE